MNIIENVIINLILVIFPILLYFIYNCYRELKCEKYNNLMLDVSLVSSLYLVYRFGHLEDNALALLFCNLPIIVAYIKKQPSVAVLLSLIILIYSSTYYNVSIIWLVLKYLVYLLTYYYVKRKELWLSLKECLVIRI